MRVRRHPQDIQRLDVQLGVREQCAAVGNQESVQDRLHVDEDQKRTCIEEQTTAAITAAACSRRRPSSRTQVRASAAIRQDSQAT